MKAMTSRKRVTRMIKKPVINVKLKMSGSDKERRKSRRKLKSKWKNELSIISTEMEVKGQKMMPNHEAGESHSPGRQRSTETGTNSAVRCEEEEVSSHG